MTKFLNAPSRRIVTLTSAPHKVGPRATQWANGQQPYTDRGIHLQVRKDEHGIMVEAVALDDGLLLAHARTIVELRRRMDPVAPKSLAMAGAATLLGYPHVDLPLAA